MVAPSIWLARWPKFLRSLLTGPSPEAVVVARMAADVRSTTVANKRLVEECCGRPAEVRAALAARDTMTEEERVAATQLQNRVRARIQGLDTTLIQSRIDVIETQPFILCGQSYGRLINLCCIRKNMNMLFAVSSIGCMPRGVYGLDCYESRLKIPLVP